MDRANIAKRSLSNDPDLYRRMLKNLLPAGYEAKRAAAKRTGKSIVGRL
jgi:hypothetical protein